MNVPITPCLLEIFEKGLGQVGANLNKFNYPCLCCLGTHNEVIPNEVLHFGLMPLFMVKHLIILYNPNRPKNNPSKSYQFLIF